MRTYEMGKWKVFDELFGYYNLGVLVFLCQSESVNNNVVNTFEGLIILIHQSPRIHWTVSSLHHIPSEVVHTYYLTELL